MTRVAQARLGVLVVFIGIGMMLGTLLSRVPTVRDLLEVSPSQLATLLVIGFTGGLVAPLIVGAVVARYGMHRVFAVSAVGMMGAVWALGVSAQAGSRVGYAAGLWVCSFFWAFVDAGANTEAANVERRVGKSIMPQFHAAFSVGMLGAIALGWVASVTGLAPVWHFGAGATVVGVSLLLASGPAVLDKGRALDVGGSPFSHAREAFTDRRTLRIGLILFFAFLAEMAATDWVPLAIVDGFGQTEAVGIGFFAAFVAAMVGVRLVGHRFIDRWGRVTSLRACASLIAAGTLVFALSPVLWLLPLGLLLWGVGASLGFPLGMSAAADDPARAAARVGAVSAFATIAGLTMPQLIGHLGEVVPLRQALLVVVGGAAVMFALAGAVRKPEAAGVTAR